MISPISYYMGLVVLKMSPPPKLVMPSNIGNQNGDDLPDIHGGSKHQGAKLLDLRVNAPPSKASSRSKISTINFVDGCWEVFQATCVFPPGFHEKNNQVGSGSSRKE